MYNRLKMIKNQNKLNIASWSLEKELCSVNGELYRKRVKLNRVLN